MLEVLTAMDAYFDSPEKWTKGYGWRDKDGSPCSEDEAVCACFLGAMGMSGPTLDEIWEIYNLFNKHVCDGFISSWNDAPERTFEDVKAALKVLIENARVDHAPRTHVPHLEGQFYNQMPKTREWTDLKLYNFDGTNLYQWFGRRWQTHVPGGREGFYSVFKDQATEVFMVRLS